MPESRPSRTEDFLPEQRDLFSLTQAAQSCRGCSLYLRATQTVFGEGKATARVVVVGEQPGDAEDVQGRPFVGPAGRVLDKALAQAGLDRASVYLTNAVKHFSFEERGKRRIHKKPRQSEVRACRPWLEGELEAVKPRVLVCLGATAAQALLGRQFRVSRQRGELVESPLAEHVTATVHPSSILRGDPEDREAALDDLVKDLEVVARVLGR
jgi:uracil-DNA glycosylase